MQWDSLRVGSFELWHRASGGIPGTARSVLLLCPECQFYQPDDTTLRVGGNLPIGCCLTAMDMVAYRPPRRKAMAAESPLKRRAENAVRNKSTKLPCLARQERGYGDLIWIKSQS